MSRREKAGRRARSWGRTAWNAVRANGESLLGIIPAPRALCFYVTYRCNLRCRTCGIWKHRPYEAGEDLSLQEIAAVIADPLFTSLEYVNINGGEPNLRSDLPEIIQILLQRLNRLRAISLNSNGIPTQAAVRNVKELAALCRGQGIPFSVSISLHGQGDLYDELSGIKGGWHQVESTLERLQELQNECGFKLTTNCVVSAFNAAAIEDMRTLSRKTGIPANFTLAEVRERFFNLEMGAGFSLREEQKPEVIRFFRRLSREEPFLRHHRLRYQVLANMLELGRPRRLACHYRMGGAILGSRGELFYCKFSREIGNCRQRSAREIYFDPEQLRYRKRELLAAVCPHCLPNTFNRLEAEKDCGRYLTFMAKEAFSGILNKGNREP